MIFPLTVEQWLLATLVMIAGATIQGLIGYGVALLGAPLLYLINPLLVPAPVLMIGMMLPAMILLRDWRAVQPKDVAWALPGSLGGVILAAVLLSVISAQSLGPLFGALVLFGVGLSVAGRMPEPKPLHMLGAAGLSSFMGTATSIGGPPLALVFQHFNGPRLRGTLSAIFVPAGILSLAALALVGRFGGEEVLLGLALLPGVVAGFLLSGKIAPAVDHRWLRPVVLGVSATAAVAVIIRSV